MNDSHTSWTDNVFVSGREEDEIELVLGTILEDKSYENDKEDLLEKEVDLKRHDIDSKQPRLITSHLYKEKNQIFRSPPAVSSKQRYNKPHKRKK